jgi:membrane associated rhomboid family serine protease
MSTDTTPARRSDRESGFLFIGAMVALMWGAEVVDTIIGGDLDQYGIEPRQADGLIGIATAPFLHAGFGHLIGNTIPFVLLGAAIALSGLARVATATAIIAVIGGAGTWLVAPSGTDHIGASGIVFGYATYLIARGIYSRNIVHLLVGVVVIGVYGTTLLFGLVPQDGISWQGHLFGGVGGVVAASVLNRRAEKKQQQKPPEASLLGAG